MTTTAQTPDNQASPKPFVLCAVDASAASEETVEAALSYCRGRAAGILFLWILEPQLFRCTYPVAVGAVGTWGLPWTLLRAVERAREQGITASSVVRIGERERVLEAETETLQPEAVFAAAQRIVRCPRCHARHDPRAVHFCPREHLQHAHERPAMAARSK